MNVTGWHGWRQTIPRPESGPSVAPGADVAAAVGHARLLAGQGRHAQALAWMERAARLAPDDRAVLYALAAVRLGAGDGTGAAEAVENVMAAGQGFRAGLRLLVLACCAAGAWARAAVALERFFTRYGFDPALSVPADLTCQHMGRSGWCALDGGRGVLHWGGLPQGCVPVVWLDGSRFGPRRMAGTSMSLPPRWRQAREIGILHDGMPLLGGSPDPVALCQVAGVALPDGQGIAGWAIMPARPEGRPALYLMDAHGRRRLKLTRRIVPMAAAIAGPSTSVWAFRVGWADIAPQGCVRIVTGQGRDLTGSPLPVRLPRARRVFPATRARGDGLLHPPGRAARCRVVVAVHADRDRTLACLDSVLATLARRVEGPVVEIMVVDDASPDPVLAAVLDDLATQGRIVLRRHETNRGYPAAVNTALSDATGMDVVLLNSDTLVADGWLDEMLRAAYARADAGTVSPLSNDATILTWPDPERPSPLAGGMDDVRHFMAAALTANGGQGPEIPTGHGFCMLIRHDCLRHTGLFRPELYGRGYGEENDFCMRARLAGWRHYAAPGVFVGHAGGASFGLSRPALQQRNHWVLNRLFPGYDRLVQDHIAADPLAAARQRLSLLVWHRAVLRAGLRGTVLLVSHGRAGGVAQVVADRARMWLTEGVLPVVVEPFPDGFVIRDGRHEGSCPPLHFVWPAQGAALVALLRALGLEHVEIHHHMGHGDRARELCQRLAVPYDRYVHDYAGICPRVTLVGREGRYCGEPDITECRRCVRALGTRVEETDADRLRRKTGHDLSRARRVVVPCADVARRLARYFPDIRFGTEPLEDDRPDQTLRQFAQPLHDHSLTLMPDTGLCRVVVVGAIGPDKGYAVLLAAARDARMRDLPLEFVVVGHTSDDAPLLETGRVFITGPYEPGQAVALIRSCGGQVGLVPSICPETWCFTLTLLWRAGLRSVAFDLGAVAARIRATGRGICVPHGLPVHQLNTFLLSYASARS